MPLLSDAIEVKRDARLSCCGRYRYVLTRTWDYGAPVVLMIGLNPSTADATKDDPTVRRCVGFARDWGFGGLALANLFAFRATAPLALLSAHNPVGPENDAWIRRLVASASAVVVSWGVHGGLQGRDQKVLAQIPTPLCLGRTKDGFPRHPLYLSKATQLEPFKLGA